MKTTLEKLKELNEWTHLESYHSIYGSVHRLASGEWQGKVNLPGDKRGRLAETFLSADVAKQQVKERWAKENKK